MDTPDAIVEKTLRVNAMSHFWVGLTYFLHFYQILYGIFCFFFIATILYKCPFVVMPLFQTYKAFLPAMTDKNHGHLVCVASSAGLIGVNGLAGKAFTHVLLSLTQLLSHQWCFWNTNKVLHGFKSFKQHVWQEIFLKNLSFIMNVH